MDMFSINRMRNNNGMASRVKMTIASHMRQLKHRKEEESTELKLTFLIMNRK